LNALISHAALVLGMSVSEGTMAFDEQGSRVTPLLPEFGLYYPYIHFRSERWLKVVALYWPKLARIVPPDYRTRDPELVQKLNDHLGFVINLTPELVRTEVATSFSNLLDGLPSADLDRWRIDLYEAERASDIRAKPPDADRLEIPEPLVEHFPMFPHETTAQLLHPSPLAFAGVHSSEVDRDLERRLFHARLAAESRVGWLAMHPELAWLYKCHFTDALARRNRLTPITDQLPAHAAVAGLETGDFLGTEDQQLDIATRFGLLALDAVIPSNLDAVPVEKIIEVRQRFGPEFDRWRRYTAEVGAILAEQLRGVESPAVLQGYLEEAVRSYARQPMEELRRGLSDVGLDAALTAVNSKFELPAGLAVAGLGAAPPVAAAAGIAATVMDLRRSARAKAHAITATPVAYLLDLKETLADTSFLQRVIAAMRRAAGMRG
jgi:hypothetical protein